VRGESTRKREVSAATGSGRADAFAHGSSGSIKGEETNLSAATVGRTEAARVVGGDGKKLTTPPKTTTYMTYTLSNTMISS